MLAQIDVLTEKDGAGLPDRAALGRWWNEIERWRERMDLFAGRATTQSGPLIMPQT
jgi:hypothetical protein